MHKHNIMRYRVLQVYCSIFCSFIFFGLFASHLPLHFSPGISNNQIWPLIGRLYEMSRTYIIDRATFCCNTRYNTCGEERAIFCEHPVWYLRGRWVASVPGLFARPTPPQQDPQHQGSSQSFSQGVGGRWINL